MTEDMTLGQRVAFYRRRRGVTQTVLAGLVGRTEAWVRNIEHDRIPLDRLSVLRQLADTLEVPLGDLLDEPGLTAWKDGADRRSVSPLRAALTNHRQFLAGPPRSEPPRLDTLSAEIAAQWDNYQGSRYARVAQRLPRLITEAQTACHHHGPAGEAGARAHVLAASAHQLATTFLTKLGEGDLAYISASNGLAAAQLSGRDLVIGSLYRSMAHALVSIGQFEQAMALTRAAVAELERGARHRTPEHLSVYGTLHLVGSVAAARQGERAETTAFLAKAGQAAQRLGHDANHGWSAFGPTNVDIHRVTTALELGDIQIAVDLGPRIDTSALPIERRVRHAIETARALARWARTDDALDILLNAEHYAPEQIRYHHLSRRLVQEMIRRPVPAQAAIRLACRMGVHGTGFPRS